jgi:outer membrane protein assembly factor BamB
MDAGDGRSRIDRRWLAVVSLAFAGLLSACGSSDDASSGATGSAVEGPSADGGVVTAPLPSSMCPGGSAPQVVAYEFDGGGVEWVSCTDEIDYWSLLPVVDGVVYVATYNLGAPSNVTALDAATGEPIEDAPPPPPARGTVEGRPYTGQPARVEVGDVTVIGGQDDAVRAISADGTELWSQPGIWAYDDVWAIDDGAVFAFEREVSRLVAYEVDTGDVRWFHEGDPYREGLWPFYAVDGRLYTLWSNLQVRSTVDGELLWRTDYPAEEMEAVGLRMTGVDTDGTSVFVSFATEASGGD